MNSAIAKPWTDWVNSFDKENVVAGCRPVPTAFGVLAIIGIILAFRYVPWLRDISGLKNALIPIAFVLFGGACSLGTWLAGTTRPNAMGLFQLLDMFGYSCTLLSCSAYSSGGASHAFAGLYALCLIYWGTQYALTLFLVVEFLAMPVVFISVGWADPISGMLLAFSPVFMFSMAARTGHFRKQQARTGRVEDVLSRLDNLLENQSSSTSNDLQARVGTFVHEVKNNLVATAWDMQDADTTATDKRGALDLIAQTEKDVSAAVSQMETFLEKLRFDQREKPTFWLKEVSGSLAETHEHMVSTGRLVLDEIPNTQIAGSMELTVMALNNLIENGLEAGAEKIVLGGESLPDGTTSLLLKDNGPGLPGEIQKNIFKPYNTLDKEHGVGLGIYLAARVIRSEGGAIDLVLSSAEGTTFKVLLPPAEVAVTPEG